MDNTALSIRIYSFFLFLMGTVLVMNPNLILTLFGFAKTSEIWIRMLGLFTFTTGFYYFYSSRHQQLAFYKATIFGRLFFFLMTIVFVFAFRQSMMLALIGSVDLTGALWTCMTPYKKTK